MLCAMHFWTLSIADLRYTVHHSKMAIYICDPKQFPDQRTALRSWDWDQHGFSLWEAIWKGWNASADNTPLQFHRKGQVWGTSLLSLSSQNKKLQYWILPSILLGYYSTCLIWWATEKQAIPALIRFLFLAQCVQQPVIIMGYMAAAHNQIIMGEKSPKHNNLLLFK